MVEKTWKKKEFAPLVVKFEICCVSILYFFEVDSWVGLVTVFLGPRIRGFFVLEKWG